MGWLASLLMLLAGAGCAYTVLAASVVARATAGRRAAAPPRPAAWPRVTVLKPLYGDEPRLRENLDTVLRQDYPGDFEVVFGLGDPDDAARPVAEAVRDAFPRRRVAIVIDPRRWGSNGKVSSLVNMAAHARGDVMVLADSDMSVGPDYLTRLVEALDRPGVGAVTCLYRGVALPNIWSRLAARWIDWHFLPNVLVGLALGLAKPCMGSTIALRRDTLDRIGGFRAFADRLADDYEIGAAVRHLGLEVAVPRDLVLGHLCAATTPGEVLRQELRWARTIRSVDAGGFFGSVVTNPIPLATLAALASGFTALAMAVLAAAVALRLLLQLLIARYLGRRPNGLILGPVRDYAAFIVFVSSFWPGAISWRGHRFALRRDGSLTSSDTAGT